MKIHFAQSSTNVFFLAIVIFNVKKLKEYFGILENTLSPFAFLQSYMFRFIDSCVFMLNMWPQTAAGELHLLIKDLQIPILRTTCVMRL